jgi:hypothetical protein
VRLLVAEDQFAEVLVVRDQDPLLPLGPAQDIVVRQA